MQTTVQGYCVGVVVSLTVVGVGTSVVDILVDVFLVVCVSVVVFSVIVGVVVSVIKKRKKNQTLVKHLSVL